MRALLVKEFMIKKEKKSSGLTAIKTDNLAPGIVCLLEGKAVGVLISEKSNVP